MRSKHEEVRVTTMHEVPTEIWYIEALYNASDLIEVITPFRPLLVPFLVCRLRLHHHHRHHHS